jgi:hypothetical protein
MKRFLTPSIFGCYLDDFMDNLYILYFDPNLWILHFFNGDLVYLWFKIKLKFSIIDT